MNDAARIFATVRQTVWPDAAKSCALAAALAGYLCAATPAFANSSDTQAGDFAQPNLDDAFDGDYAIVAVGAGYVPDYDGSDDYGFQFGGAVRGEVSGIGFATRGIGIELDVMPDLPGDIDVSFGPDLRYRKVRTGSVDDAVVDLLPKLKSTVELGFGAGVSVKNVLTPLDSISLSGGTRWDISGHGGGQSISAQVSYFTALSQGMGAGLSVGTSWHDGKYADYYYSITPEGSAATGGALPVYDAKGGMKSWDARAYYGIDLDGNFRNGGFGIAAAISYERLVNSAAETPIVSMRGSHNQFAVLAGIGYVF
ncbi:MipA/OmpV family protein [Croceicoccus bisphenolivorans]|uniref:MipA/OmpV family protein n=1 Tax=Croceicoccus bisphenolivorans TaxID=1783232 RepID=UPI00083344DF|nr:MipA/OmpV family protein [Croceicoccus bisphenolivorans]